LFTAPEQTDLERTVEFTYTVKDDDGALSESAKVTLIVTRPNAQPMAVDDSFEVTTDAPSELDVTANDTDSDGEIDPSSIAFGVSAPLYGSIQIDPVSGLITYLPNEGVEAGTEDRFTYVVGDDQGMVSEPATVTVRFKNLPPTAIDDSIDIPWGTSALLNVLANDTDVDGTVDAASVTVPDDELQSALGTVSVESETGVVTYTPRQTTLIGSVDTFSYTISDNMGLVSDPGKVVVNIVADIEASVQLGDTVSFSVFEPFDGSTAGLTINTNFDDIFGAGSLGYISLDSSSGVMSFSPYGETGVATFRYQLVGPQGPASRVLTVSILIAQDGSESPNLSPVADAGLDQTVFEGTSVTLDGGLSGDADGSIANYLWTDEGGYEVGTGVSPVLSDLSVGVNTITLLVTDNDGATSSDSVLINVLMPESLAPSAIDDAFSAAPGGTTKIFVTANDTVGVEGRTLDTSSLVITSPASLGTATVVNDGSQGGHVSYAAPTGFTGTDTFTYTVSDNEGDVSNEATVTITIPSDSGPVLITNDDGFNSTITVDRGNPVVVNVLANDTINQGIPLSAVSIEIEAQPSSGAVVVNSDRTITYTSAADTSTTMAVTFTYLLRYQDEVSNVSTVQVSVVDLAVPLAEHRSGQTFLTWEETAPSDEYHVYRSTAPITKSNLGSANRLTDRWGPLASNTTFNRHGGNNAPLNYVITDLGDPLGDDEGLFVYTSQPGEDGLAYYAVTTVRNGVEDVSSLRASNAVSESVSTPRDVLTVSVNGGLGRVYTQYMDYSNWNPTFNGYAYNYSVALPSNYDAAKSYPLTVELHAYGESYKFRNNAEFDWEVIQLFPHDPGVSYGLVPSWWYGYASEHDYRTEGVPTSGTIENFTEQRVMRAIDELILLDDVNVDEQLIHVIGNSMGASGALSLGMRYPSLISGIYASQPMTNYGASTFANAELRDMWGSTSDNLPIVNRGPRSTDISLYGEDGVQSIGVWNWMNHPQQLIDRRGDEFAYLMTSHGKQDTIIDWETQGKPLVQAITDARVGFSAVYNEKPHTWANFDAVVKSMFGLGQLGVLEPFPWKYPLELSFPAIQNASGSGPISPDPNDSPSILNIGVDTYNLDFEWDTNIVDTTNTYGITIWSTGVAQTADITPRRTKSFNVNAGDQCNWTVINLIDNSSVTGVVSADLDSLVTVKDVQIEAGAGTRLRIEC
jgi:pimeloyl-ACP methyl ester carboxylesterase